MSNTMEDLYDSIKEQIQADPEFQEKRRALSGASVAAMDQLEAFCGKEGLNFLDLVFLLNSEGQELFQQALFQAAVRLGMELGRMSA